MKEFTTKNLSAFCIKPPSAASVTASRFAAFCIPSLAHTAAAQAGALAMSLQALHV